MYQLFIWKMNPLDQGEFNLHSASLAYGTENLQDLVESNDVAIAVPITPSARGKYCYLQTTTPELEINAANMPIELPTTFDIVIYEHGFELSLLGASYIRWQRGSTMGEEFFRFKAPINPAVNTGYASVSILTIPLDSSIKLAMGFSVHEGRNFTFSSSPENGFDLSLDQHDSVYHLPTGPGYDAFAYCAASKELQPKFKKEDIFIVR